MTISNRISLIELAQMPIGDIAALPAEQLALLQESTSAALHSARRICEWLEGAIALKYTDRAVMARLEAGKDTGTIRFNDGDVTVIADLPKRVDWNQKKLASVVERIRDEGEDPAEYVDLTIRVPERKYASWPGHIRAVFEAARTVRRGRPSFRLCLSSKATSGESNETGEQ